MKPGPCNHHRPKFCIFMNQPLKLDSTGNGGTDLDLKARHSVVYIVSHLTGMNATFVSKIFIYLFMAIAFFFLFWYPPTLAGGNKSSDTGEEYLAAWRYEGIAAPLHVPMNDVSPICAVN